MGELRFQGKVQEAPPTPLFVNDERFIAAGFLSGWDVVEYTSNLLSESKVMSSHGVMAFFRKVFVVPCDCKGENDRCTICAGGGEDWREFMRFRDYVRDPSHGIGIEQLGEIARALMEARTERPTKGPSDSVSGPSSTSENSERGPS